MKLPFGTKEFAPRAVVRFVVATAAGFSTASVTKSAIRYNLPETADETRTQRFVQYIGVSVIGALAAKQANDFAGEIFDTYAGQVESLAAEVQAEIDKQSS